MKKLVFGLIMGLAVASYAGEESIPLVIENSTVALTTTNTTVKMRGQLDSIKVDVTGVTTNALVIKLGSETIYTGSSISADTTLRPRAICVNAADGAALIGVSNTVEKILLVDEALTVTLAETAPVTNATVKLYFKLISSKY